MSARIRRTLMTFERTVFCMGIATLGACNDSAPAQQPIAPAAQTPAPTSGTTAAPVSGASGTTATPTAAASTGGAPSAVAGSVASAAVGGASAVAGSLAAAGSGGTDAAGAAGGGAAAGSGAAAGNGAPTAAAYPDCKSEDLGPCGTFTTQAGVTLTLGSYGAVTEKNLGKGFEVPLATGDSDGGASCDSVIASFGEDPEQSKPLKDVTGIDFALYTVYRPATLAEGEKLPVITWGNGTCAKAEGYGALLRYVASHGFVVIAANSRWTLTGSPMTKAIDFAEAANADADSPFYQHLDLDKVGAMGHSQGGMATIEAARDERVKTVIIWNGGSSAAKPYLAVTGDKDIGSPTVSGIKGKVEAAPPGAWLYYHNTVGTGSVPGHLTLMTEPERVVEPTVAWFKYQLLGDMPSRDWFVGATCKLCSPTDDYGYGQAGLN